MNEAIEQYVNEEANMVLNMLASGKIDRVKAVCCKNNIEWASQKIELSFKAKLALAAIADNILKGGK